MEIGKINIVVEVDDELYLVAMNKEKLDAINYLIKQSVDVIFPIHKKQEDLLRWVGVVK